MLIEDLKRRTLNLAKVSLSEGEVPVGCVIARAVAWTSDQKCSYETIGEGRNCPNATKNPTRHAEFEAVDQVLEFCRRSNLNLEEIFQNSILIVNVEPCIMCAGAIVRLGIPRVVYGCSNPRFGGFGSVLDVPKSLDVDIMVEVGYAGDESIELLKTFYACENPNAPNPIKKEGRKIIKNDK
uniref:CMP/dCMP-type deaminase domain-containing protein n=1 Tax=Romanomermis culicivorax TaxID=13658 RepID=A0A915JR99_ROMCU